MKRKKYVVYCVTCIVNGKKYIGKHTRNNVFPNYLGSGTLQRRAIKKYGKENFVKQILYESDSPELLNEMEEYYIEYYNAVNSDLFYNIVDGGIGFSHSEKLSKAKTMTNAMREKTGKKHHSSKKVIQYNMNGNFIKVWECIRDVEKQLNIHSSSIISCIKGKTIQAGHFLWQYYTDNYPKSIAPQVSTRGKKSGKTQVKAVRNITTGKIYNSIVEACKEGYNDTNISLCCKGKLKTTGGCQWEYI